MVGIDAEAAPKCNVKKQVNERCPKAIAFQGLCTLRLQYIHRLALPCFCDSRRYGGGEGRVSLDMCQIARERWGLDVPFLLTTHPPCVVGLRVREEV